MANEPLKGNGFVEVTETRPKKIGQCLNRHTSSMKKIKDELKHGK